MIKLFLIIFIAGIVETFIYTCYLIEFRKNNEVTSSLSLTIYMIIYMSILNIAIKDINGWSLILIYCLSNGVGNYIRMKLEKDKTKLKKLLRLMKYRPKGKR